DEMLEQLYGEGSLSPDAVDALLDESLAPRGPDTLFDLAVELGLSEGHLVLDAGCGDGRRTADLVRRSGCVAVGLDLLGANLERRHETFADAGNAEAAGRIRFVRGDIQRLPFADASFDAVWSRDMLIHIPDLPAAFSECRRVVRRGGWMLVFQMFATPRLSDDDAVRLFTPLAVIPRNADPNFFETSAREAGWTIERMD